MDPKDATDSEAVWGALMKKVRPWLGNFWKDQEEKNERCYRSEEYLDLAIKTWRVNRSERVFAVYTICGTRLAEERVSAVDEEN